MKNLFKLLLAACTMLAVASCVQFDDSDIQDEIANIKSRLTTLEETVNAMNGNITTLQGLVNALNGKVSIESVKEYGGGWIITFSDGKTATIRNGAGGSAPVIGVKKDSDGIYYWTLDGSWLLDDGGKKMPVSGTDGKDGKDGSDGIAPQLKIEDGFWYLSTDEGKTWTKLGKATGEDGKDGTDGDAIFKSVSWDESFFYFVLADGTMLRIARGAGGALAITVVPDYSDGSVKALKEEFSLRFDVYPEAAARNLAALKTDLFKLKVVYTIPTKASPGESVTLPIKSVEGLDGILILNVDGSKLSDDFVTRTVGASASLSVVYGENGMTSGYFPLKYFDPLNGHKYIDLGLPSGVKWADRNLGADTPEEFGDYYAWGEIQPYYERGYALWDNPVWRAEKGAGYAWESYRWCDGTDVGLTKYNSELNYGKVDHKRVLDPADDAATANWGGYWRMPTDEEIIELVLQCNWNETKQNGVDGWLATSKDGKTTLFFPSAGKFVGTSRSSGCSYWSSTRFNRSAVSLSYDGIMYPNLDSRVRGLTIHPVYGKFVQILAVSIDPASLQLSAGATETLSATILPSNATAPGILWETSDEEVATVDDDGKVTAVKDGVAVITAWTTNGLSATCTVTVGEGQAAVEPEYVDLGLSVKWATFNVGATKPEEPGDYFAWGETEPYYEPGTAMNPVWKNGKEAGYKWPSYKWCTGNGDGTFTKYCSFKESGTVDHKTVLEPQDDAATANWGELWRTPTENEWSELITNCTWTYTTENGVKGCRVKSNKAGFTNNSIFLPVTGVMGVSLQWPNDILYWSSFQNFDSYSQYQGCCLSVFTKDGTLQQYLQDDTMISIDHTTRDTGIPVRPVYGKLVPVQSISVSPKSLELEPGKNGKVSATLTPAKVSDPRVRYVSADETIATVDKDGNVVAQAEGTTTITAWSSNGLSATCTVTVGESQATVEPEYVDLGLSVKWATFNLGATKPEEPGDYFAWGETEPYYKAHHLWDNSNKPTEWKPGKESGYDWPSYKWYDQNKHETTKYTFIGDSGPVDHIVVLDPEDDAATATWGENWRTPTLSEFLELRNEDNCKWTWTDNYNGDKEVKGYIITSKVPGYEGNSIFLRRTGYCDQEYFCASWPEPEHYSGFYWLSFATEGRARWGKGDGGYLYNGLSLAFAFSESDATSIDDYRCMGLAVRPVYGKLVHVTSISLSPANMELAIGESKEITKTVLPTNATEQTVLLYSSNDSVVKVDQEAGTVLGVAEGTVTITGYASNGLSATCTITVKGAAEQQPKYVDLGLGVKWATCNVGATKPEEPGDYFAWGETTPYYESGYAISAYPVWMPGKEAGYDWPSYKWCNGSWNNLNKYCTDSYYGYVDYNTILDPEDDAATAVLGEPWRMPTKADWDELLNPANCEWVWTTEGNMAGYRVTSRIPGYTTQSIFLPAAGERYEMTIQDVGEYAQYWSSSLEEQSPSRAWARNIYEDCHLEDLDSNWFDMDRCYGLSVRPVCE